MVIRYSDNTIAIAIIIKSRKCTVGADVETLQNSRPRDHFCYRLTLDTQNGRQAIIRDINRRQTYK